MRFLNNKLTEAAKDRYRWTYDGNIYHFEEVLGRAHMQTYAVSLKQAANNFIWQAAEAYGYDRSQGHHIDIDTFEIERQEKVAPKKYKIPDDEKSEDGVEPIDNARCELCGNLLTDAGECPLCDLGDTTILEESVIKHEILNPKLWDANDRLFSDIRAKIEDIVRTFRQLLAKKDVDIHIIDAYIIGSNANFNYSETSDLDVHIIVDEDNDCVKKHLSIIFDAYRHIFDDKYDISIKGIPVELYVQNKESALSNVSSGVYSIRENRWLKTPTKDYKTPEIDDIKFSNEVNYWERKYFNIKINPTLDDIDEFIDDIYKVRQNSLSTEGEFGFGNLVFKEIRNLGYIKDLKELKDSITAENLSI